MSESGDWEKIMSCLSANLDQVSEDLFPLHVLLLAGLALRVVPSLPVLEKACPADWAEGLRGLILVASTWLSPSKANILLCLMWVSLLQRKQLFGRAHRTTTFSLYLKTTACDGSNDQQPQRNQSKQRD